MYFDDENNEKIENAENSTVDNNENATVSSANEKEEIDTTNSSMENTGEPKKEKKTKKLGHTHVDNEAKQEEQHSRILEYLKNEHKWENYVLLVLSFMALILGCLILNGTLEVSEDFPLIGNFPKVFAWILVGLSVLAIALSLWPFFKPAFPELKKVSWPKARQFGADVARVFIFLLILVSVLLLFDAFVSKLISYILSISD